MNTPLESAAPRTVDDLDDARDDIDSAELALRSVTVPEEALAVSSTLMRLGLRGRKTRDALDAARSAAGVPSSAVESTLDLSVIDRAVSQIRTAWRALEPLANADTAGTNPKRSSWQPTPSRRCKTQPTRSRSGSAPSRRRR